ncbi:hypothetical protein D3C81_1040830 [compost metagenome]
MSTPSVLYSNISVMCDPLEAPRESKFRFIDGRIEGRNEQHGYIINWTDRK